MITQATSIQPWFTLSNASQASKFYQQAFGAVETYHMDAPDGGSVIRLSVDGSEFWISGQSTKTSTDAKTTQNVIRFILIVNDPESVFQQTIEAGAKELYPVGESHGWILGRVTDPFGIDWEIGKPISSH